MAVVNDGDGFVDVTLPTVSDIALGGNETNFPGKFFRELASRDRYLFNESLGGDATAIATFARFKQAGIAALAQGRLTLETNVPVSSTDQLAATTLYYTPYEGDVIALYDTVETRWDAFTFTQRSLSLSGLTANTNYDVFLFNNSGTLTLQAVAWSNSAAGGGTRANALSQLNGIWVKDSDKRRYLGTIRITGTTGQCEDSVVRRFVWNAQNQVDRELAIGDSSGNYVYASATIRPARGTTNVRIEVLSGLQNSIINTITGVSSQTTTSNLNFGLGLNSTTAYYPNANDQVLNQQNETISLPVALPVGYSFLQQLEAALASSTINANRIFAVYRC